MRPARPPQGSSSRRRRLKLFTKAAAEAGFLDAAEGDARLLNTGEALGTVYYRRSAPVNVPNASEGAAIAACPAGHEAIGGGAYMTHNMPMSSYPSNFQGLTGFTHWSVLVQNTTGASVDIRAYVVCVNASATDIDYGVGVTPRGGA